MGQEDHPECRVPRRALFCRRGDQKIGPYDWNVALNASSDRPRPNQWPSGEDGQRHGDLRA